MKTHLMLTVIVGLVFSAFGLEPTKTVKISVIVSSDNEKLSGQLFHPKLCPNDLNYLTFVRQEKDNRQIWLYNLKTKNLEQISPDRVSGNVEDWENSEDSFFQKYTDQLEWCPVLIAGKQYVTYVSAGKGNNMDVYLHEIGSTVHTRLTFDPEVDASPRFSPDGKRLVFVSARTGNGDLYLIEDMSKFYGKKLNEEPSLVRLTRNKSEDMLPAFSPNGRYLAFTVRTAGKFKRGPYTVALLDFKSPKRVKVFNNRIVNSKSHPSWSFDGHFVAYQISNDLKDRVVDIGVLQLKMDPMGRLVELTDLVGNTPKIAENVYPSSYRGPSWLPGSRALIYAKRESERLNPLEIVNLEQWLYNQKYERTAINSSASIHRDVDCLPNHPIIVFAGQSGLNFQIFGALLTGSDIKTKEGVANYQEHVLFK